MFSPFYSRTVRATTVALFLAGCVMPASAHMTVIRELGTAPLLGPSSSTAQMRDRVEKNQTLLREAALESGLSLAQFQQVNEAIAASKVQWVTVPRHLTVMTWRSGEHVYVIRDVKIPPRVHGWEVDLKERNAVVAVYLPSACGNLSYVRSARPAVAVVPHARKPIAIAAVVPAATAPVATTTPAAVPVPNVVAATDTAAAAPDAPVATAGAGHNPIGAIAAVVGAIVGGVEGFGGGGSSFSFGSGDGAHSSSACL
jgi:hypothetical protein